MGVLAGRYPLDGSYPADSRAARANWPAIKDRVTLRALETGVKVIELAKQRGVTPAQFSLTWCKDQPGVTAPILGPRTAEQLDELLPVLDLTLSADERLACDGLVPPGGVVTNFHNTAPWMKTPIA